MKHLVLLGIAVALVGCQAAPESQQERIEAVPRSQTASPYKGLFGFDIGKPLGVPDCPKHYDDNDKVPHTCKTKDAVFLSEDRKPAFLLNNYVSVTLDANGNVRKVQADFGEYGLQDAKDALVKKFGIPDSSDDDVFVWRYSDYIIVYGYATRFGSVYMESVADKLAENAAAQNEKDTEANKM